MTVVQVSEGTKQKLVEVAAKLQMSVKRKVSLDEAVKFLIEQYEGKKPDAELFYSFFGCLKRYDIKKAYEELKALRKEEEKRLEGLERQFSD
jgi:hypothetical protein